MTTKEVSYYVFQDKAICPGQRMVTHFAFYNAKFAMFVIYTRDTLYHGYASKMTSNLTETT